LILAALRSWFPWIQLGWLILAGASDRLWLGTFRKTGRLLYPLSISPDYDFAHAHNEFLQAGLDPGVPGLATLLAIYIGLCGMLWSLWSNTHDPGTRYFALGLAGCLLAHAIYGLTDAIALGAKLGVMFWILLGLVCGLFLSNRTSRIPFY
jgi:hypothetical protein